MCLFKTYYFFVCLLVSCALAQEESLFVDTDVQPSPINNYSTDANENVTEHLITPTPSDFLSSPESVTHTSSSQKPVMIVMATRIGMSEYAQPLASATVAVLEPPIDNTILSANVEPVYAAEQIEVPTLEPTEELAPIQVDDKLEIVAPEEDKSNQFNEQQDDRSDDTSVVSESDGDIDEENELSEPLPSPVALISPDGEGNNPPLEEEFAEAFKKVGSNGKRIRRLKPGARRRVRMRVRKMNGTTSLDGTDSGVLSASETENDVQVEAETTPRSSRRFRSTTTPVPDPSPPTIPQLDSTQGSSITSSVVMNGPKPLILIDVNSGNSEAIVTPQPQIEKPGIGGYTEKISTYFVPPPAAQIQSESSTVKPNNNSSEWLQSENSKHHDIHHDNGHYMEERDNWEKNYMNLQQNSFYNSASSEDTEPQTLASLNSGNEENGGENETSENPSNPPSSSNPEREIRDSLEDREYPRLQNTDTDIHSNPPFEPQPYFYTTASPETSIVNSQPAHEFNHDFSHNHQQNTLHSEPFAASTPDVGSPSAPSSPERNQFYSPAGPPNSHQYNSNEQHHNAAFESQRHPSPGSHYDRTKDGNTHHSDPNSYKPANIFPIQNQGSKLFPAFQSPEGLVSQSQHAGSEHSVAQQQSQHFSSGEFHSSTTPPLQFIHPNSLEHHGQPEQTYSHGGIQSSFSKLQPSSSFKSSPIDPALDGLSAPYVPPRRRPPFPGLGPNGFSIHQSPPAPAGFMSHNGNMVGPTGPVFGPQRGVPPHGPHSGNHPDYSNYPPHHVGPRGPPGPRGPLGHRGPRFENQVLPFLGRSPKLVTDDPHHSASFTQSLPSLDITPYANNGNSAKDQDTLKQGDFSKSPSREVAAYPPSSSAPHLTLPMPGLVNVPVPPTEPMAMNQVTPHRHFPPHTHSMSDRPDYEPANPPLPNGHPMQNHFDPFIQNAGSFKDPKQGGNHLNEFHSTNVPNQGAFSGDNQHHTPPEGHSTSDQNPPRFYEFGPFAGRPTNSPKYEYDQNKQQRPTAEPGFTKPYHYSEEHQHSDYDSYRPGIGSLSETGNASPNSYFRKPEVNDQEQNDQSHQEPGNEQNEVEDSKGKESDKKPIASGTGNHFSEVPYVLMFPQLVGEDKMRPAPPKLMAKEIPVVQATNTMQMSASGLSTDGKAMLGPGLTAVPVHPRQQMYQVLATAHYEKMMEKYRESKKKPPAAIYTPYGVLVPMGPAAAAAAASASTQEVYTGAYSQHQPKIKPYPNNPHHKPNSDEKQLLNLLLGAKIPSFGHMYFHKKTYLKTSRPNKHGNFKPNVEPALDILAEKLAIKLSNLEHVIPTHIAKHGFHASRGNRYSNHPETSYSELHPVQTSPHLFKNGSNVNSKPTSGQSSTQHSNTNNNNNNNYMSHSQDPRSNPESTPEFKIYLKKLLKERLAEVLEETQREAGSNEINRGVGLRFQPDPRPRFRQPYPQVRNNGNKQFMVPMQTMMTSGSAPQGRWGPVPQQNNINPVGGIFGTIKRLFSFSPFNLQRGGEQNQGPHNYNGNQNNNSNYGHMWGNGVNNNNNNNNNVNNNNNINNGNGNNGGQFNQFRPLPTVMQPAASNMYQMKMKKENSKPVKKQTKEIEKWLDLVLKSGDTSLSSTEKRSLIDQFPQSKSDDNRRTGKNTNISKRYLQSNDNQQSSVPSQPISIKVISPNSNSNKGVKSSDVTTEKFSRRNLDSNTSPIRPNSWKPILSAFFGPASRSVFNFSPSRSQSPTILTQRQKSEPAASVSSPSSNKHS